MKILLYLCRKLNHIRMKKLLTLLLIPLFVGCTADKSLTGEDLLRMLNEQQLSLVVYNNDSLSTYTRHRVDNLMQLVTNEPERLRGALVADKRIGNAAATLIALGGVSEVHTNYVTRQARQILDQAGVKLVYQSEGDMILNRDGTKQCPMDASLNGITDPKKGYEVLTRQGWALLDILNANSHSLVVLRDDEMQTYNDRGVQDLVLLVTNEPERLNDAIVADKMVGKAAASLMVAGGVREVYTNLICRSALEVFRKAGIAVHAKQVVEQILNRDRSGQCPIDALLNETDDVEQCVEILQGRFN